MKTTKYFILFFSFICLYIQAQAQIITCRSCELDSIKSEIKSLKITSNKPLVYRCRFNEKFKYGIVTSKGKIVKVAKYDTLFSTNDNTFIANTSDSSFLLSNKYIHLLALSSTSIEHLHQQYYVLKRNCDVCIWKIGESQFRAFEYDSIYYNQGYFLVQQNNIHQLDTISNTILRGPYKYWNKKIAIQYPAWKLANRLQDSLITLYADSISETATLGELCLFKNSKVYRYTFDNNAEIALNKDDENKTTIYDNDSLLLVYSAQIKKKFKADTVIVLNSNTYFIRAIHLWGVVDSIGKIILPPTFDSLYYLTHQIFAFQINNKWGVINQKDKITLQPYYKRISSFKNQIAIIENFQGQYNFINTAGTLINSQWYDSITTLKKNYKVLAKNKFGLLNEKGKEVIPTKYLQLYDFNKGIILVEDEFKHWYLVNEQQDRIIHNTFYTVQILPFNQAFIVR